MLYVSQGMIALIFNNNSHSNTSNFEIDAFAKRNAQLAIQNKAEKYEERHLIVDGKRYLYQFVDKYLADKKLIISLACDVTSKDIINKELQRNIQAQADLLESTASASVIFGQDRKIIFYNQAFVKLWGLDENFLNSFPTYEIILDKLQAQRKLPETSNYTKFRKEQLELFANITSPYNAFLYLPDSRSLRLIIIPHSYGGVLFSFEDITDKIALERSYNTLIDVQKTTLDNLHEAICVFGENGRVTLFNQRFVELWGLKSEDLVLKPLLSELIDKYHLLLKFIHDFEKYKLRTISNFIRRKNTQEIIERTDGIYINRIMVPLPDGATMITDIDITATILAERVLIEKNKALEDADRIKSEFLANVSYELRPPLTSIIGYSEMLSRKYAGELNDQQHEYVNNVVSSAQKLTNLVDDVMNLTVIEAGKVELELSEFDVIEAINSMIGLVSSQLQLNNIDCKLIYDEAKQHKMMADKTRFKQIILKLLNNSMEYSDPNSEIRIVIVGEEEFYSITVIDRGKGIPLSEQDYIFNKFYQGGSIKTSGRSGTGLGLSLVKKFVELHNGAIEFSSVENQGSSFTCKFPVYCLKQAEEADVITSER